MVAAAARDGGVARPLAERDHLARDRGARAVVRVTVMVESTCRCRRPRSVRPRRSRIWLRPGRGRRPGRLVDDHAGQVVGRRVGDDLRVRVTRLKVATPGPRCWPCRRPRWRWSRPPGRASPPGPGPGCPSRRQGDGDGRGRRAVVGDRGRCGHDARIRCETGPWKATYAVLVNLTPPVTSSRCR